MPEPLCFRWGLPILIVSLRPKCDCELVDAGLPVQSMHRCCSRSQASNSATTGGCVRRGRETLLRRRFSRLASRNPFRSTGAYATLWRLIISGQCSHYLETNTPQVAAQRVPKPLLRQHRQHRQRLALSGTGRPNRGGSRRRDFTGRSRRSSSQPGIHGR
jgi:hypothetical protein